MDSDRWKPVGAQRGVSPPLGQQPDLGCTGCYDRGDRHAGGTACTRASAQRDACHIAACLPAAYRVAVPAGFCRVVWGAADCDRAVVRAVRTHSEPQRAARAAPDGAGGADLRASAVRHAVSGARRDGVADRGCADGDLHHGASVLPARHLAQDGVPAVSRGPGDAQCTDRRRGPRGARAAQPSGEPAPPWVSLQGVRGPLGARGGIRRCGHDRRHAQLPLAGPLAVCRRDLLFGARGEEAGDRPGGRGPRLRHRRARGA